MSNNNQQVDAASDEDLRKKIPVLFSVTIVVWLVAIGINSSASLTSQLLLAINFFGLTVATGIVAYCRYGELKTSYVNPIMLFGLSIFAFSSLVRVSELGDIGLGFHFFFVTAGLAFNRHLWFWTAFGFGGVCLAIVGTEIQPSTYLGGSLFLAVLAGAVVFVFRRRFLYDSIHAQLELEHRHKDSERLVKELQQAVAQRDAALERIKASEADYRDLLYKAPVPMLIHDGTKIQQCNGAMCDLLEVKESELRGTEVIRLIRGQSDDWFSSLSGLPAHVEVAGVNCQAANISISFDSKPAHLIVIGITAITPPSVKDGLPASTPVGDNSPSQPDAEQRLRVMVAEDNAVNMEIACAMVESLGHTIVGRVVDGQQLLDDAPDIQPDVVLLDLSMPRVDGFAAAEGLRNMPQLKELVIIAVSAHADAESKRNAKEKGVDGYITKPIDLQVLGDKIASLAANK